MNLREKEIKISKSAKSGNLDDAQRQYEELLAYRQRVYKQSIIVLKATIYTYCKVYQVTLDEFCQKFKIEKYYLEKVLNGLLRPTEGFVNRFINEIEEEMKWWN